MLLKHYFEFHSNVFSASLSSVSIRSIRNIRLDHVSVCLSVCRSVRKVYCGKTAERIRMPFGVVSGVGRRMGVFVCSGDYTASTCSGRVHSLPPEVATQSSQMSLGRTCSIIKTFKNKIRR